MLQRGEGDAMRGKRPHPSTAAAATTTMTSGPDVRPVEEHALPLDPALMTERQQLAFLLRATAHEASASESPHSSESGSDDERRSRRAPAKKKPRRERTVKPATTPTGQRGRGRPPRSGVRPIKAPAPSVAHGRAPSRTSPRTAARRMAADAENDAGAANGKAITSVSVSASAVKRVKAAPQCALCCDYDSALEASFSDALFLCPACDQKYPTQQALGRLCMT